MAAMSFLNRSEEATVPSWPARSITAGKALGYHVSTPWMFPLKQAPFTSKPSTPRLITAPPKYKHEYNPYRRQHQSLGKRRLRKANVQEPPPTPTPIATATATCQGYCRNPFSFSSRQRLTAKFGQSAYDSR